eukprot:g10489.t1
MSTAVSDAVDTTKKVWEPKPVTECHIQYRVGTVQDCDHIRRVFFSTGFVYYEEADAPTEFYFNAKWNGIWAKRLISSDQVYIVAETVKYPGYPEIVGFARFQRGRKLQNNDSGIMTKDFSVELMSLYVLPEWKRRGIGKRMLCIAASHAIKAFSVEKAFCWCVDDENSRAFYQSMGCCVLLTKEDHGTQTAFNLDLNALRLLGERLGANIG